MTFGSTEWIGASANEVLVSATAAAIGAVLAWGAAQVRRRLNELRARRFWRFAARQEPVLVIGTQTGRIEAWERSGLVGMGDIHALVTIQEQLHKIGIKGRIRAARDLPASEWRGNLVLLGGPDSNSLTAEVYDRIEGSLSFVFPLWKQHIVSIDDKRTGAVMTPEPDGQGTGLAEDYGIIVRTANPFAPAESDVLILAGCWGHGTAAAAEILASKSFLRHPVCSSGGPFEALVRTQVGGGYPHSPSMMEVRPLVSRVKSE